MPPHDVERERGAGAWVRAWWRAAVGELVATLVLVFLGVATTVVPLPAVPLTHPALAFGFLVAANVAVFGPVSGAHMNPAVSLAALATGRLGVAATVAYVAAQLAGALLGFGLLVAVMPGRLAGGAGCSVAHVAAGGALAVEAVLAGTLSLLCCANWAAEEAGAPPDNALPIKFGLTVAGLIYAGGPLSGASFNPARSLGPAVWQNYWENHWVFWVGPVVGAVAAAFLHRLLHRPPAHPAHPPRPATDEHLPLQDKV